jgi:anthranilate/para-aminobenzoate synthase component II
MIYLVDFEDSFTFNIKQLLSTYGEVKIVHYREFIDHLSSMCEGDVVCFGPGPGHVEEYVDVVATIFELLPTHIFKVGICLGHQLLLNICYNWPIQNCSIPLHGSKVGLKFRDNYFEVQRYNSWTVVPDVIIGENYYDDIGELAWHFNKDLKLLTMQFHPESVGTSCPYELFIPMLEYLRYPLRDEEYKPCRDLR